MAMSKKDFVALADVIRNVNQYSEVQHHFNGTQLRVLADFCKSQNPNFMRDRWLDYIAGKCGPNGGAR